MAAPSITPSEARETALELVDQARHASLESPRRLAILAEAQVFATLSLAPAEFAVAEPAEAPKPTRSRKPKVAEEVTA